MISIDDILVSEDLFESKFCCDIAACKGICCVEGNAGAPLEEIETQVLEDEYDNYKPYLKPEGVASIGENGFFVVDQDGDYTTPLVNNAECAYSVEHNGVTLCAIEQAYNDGKTGFRKPLSCFLYPIRVIYLNDRVYALNYHRWSVCSCAETLGLKKSVPVYRFLETPIRERFGDEFFEAMEQAEKLLNEE